MSSDETPRTLGFAHMLMQVADIEASKRFYVDLLGFTSARPSRWPTGVRSSRSCRGWR
jgi:catechol-2,3-dioxygenase